MKKNLKKKFLTRFSGATEQGLFHNYLFTG
jgi:hypothetical protein